MFYSLFRFNDAKGEDLPRFKLYTECVARVDVGSLVVHPAAGKRAVAGWVKGHIESLAIKGICFLRGVQIRKHVQSWFQPQQQPKRSKEGSSRPQEALTSQQGREESGQRLHSPSKAVT